MKIFLTPAVTIAFVSVFSLCLQAQNKDYVITVNNDTIPCKITTPVFVTNGNYKSKDMTEPTQIRLEDIKEFYISKDSSLHRRVFRAEYKHGAAAFLTVVESGKINLYVATYDHTYQGNFNNTLSSSTTIWYIGKGNDSANLLKSSSFYLTLKSRKSRENVLANMIMDNKEVYDKYLADDKFSFKQIRNLVHLYNTGQPLSN